MPFCRECGKQVEEDWVTCPYCSQPIGPPTSKMISEINIEESVKASLKCNECGSVGATLIPCKECKKIYACDLDNCTTNGSFKARKHLQTGYEGSELLFHRKHCSECHLDYLLETINSECKHCKMKFQFPDRYYRAPHTGGNTFLETEGEYWENWEHYMGSSLSLTKHWPYVDTDEYCRECGYNRYELQHCKESLTASKKSLKKLEKEPKSLKRDIQGEIKRIEYNTERIAELEIEFIERKDLYEKLS